MIHKYKFWHCTFNILRYIKYWQWRIEPLKAVRGHATFVDGKMLSVTKYGIKIRSA